MKSLEEIAQMDRMSRAGEFVTLTKMLLKHGQAPNLDSAIDREARLPERVRTVLKAPVAGAITTNVGVSADQRLLSSAFLQSLQTVGAFDAVLGSAIRVDMDRPQFLMQTTVLTGHQVAEATRASRPSPIVTSTGSVLSSSFGSGATVPP